MTRPSMVVRVRRFDILHTAASSSPGPSQFHVFPLQPACRVSPGGVGALGGLAGAAAVTRALSALLFGLTPLDSTTFTGVAVLFAVVSTLASLLPAHRATRVDPLVALRNE